MTATWHIGDARTVLATLPDNSVDLVLTSPPFLALRSYLPADDPNKALEMGSEPTPGEFLDGLLDVVVECRRVLAPHGSLCIELGDTYAGSGGAGGDYAEAGLRDGAPKFGGSAKERRKGATGWPLDKSLCLIPEAFRFALAYGRNPHTGRTIEPWRVRNVVRWCRPNPPVGALADKFRPATSEVVVACTGRSRYFDLDAVRTEAQIQMGRAVAGNNVKGSDDQSHRFAERVDSNPAGAPPLDWWRIPTQPYRGSHYATWPEDLCITPILAMCPSRVCTVCGKPSERITERSPEYEAAREAIGDFNQRGRDGDGVSGSRSVLTKAAGRDITSAENITTGWSDCGCVRNPNEIDTLRGTPADIIRPGLTWSGQYGTHDDGRWRPGIVLDPFAGSGTTGAIAIGHGRSFIGIDLDERNYHLARERIGMWLTEAPPSVAIVDTGGLV